MKDKRGLLKYALRVFSMGLLGAFLFFLIENDLTWRNVLLATSIDVVVTIIFVIIRCISDAKQ